MNDDLQRELLAELIGTFVLVFVGAAAVLVAPIFSVVVPALAHGLILVALIYTYGHISGAQVNPAVTLGLAIGGQQDWTKSAYYIVAQFIGGIIAAAVLAMVFPQDNAAVAGFLGRERLQLWPDEGLPHRGLGLDGGAIRSHPDLFSWSAPYSRRPLMATRASWPAWASA